MSLLHDDGRSFEQLRDDFHWQVPARFNMADWAIDRHRDDPAPALHFEDAGGKAATLSFADLHRQACRWANALGALGVGRGERVAIVLAQRPETAIAHLGTYKAGAVALPLSVLFGPEALAYRLRDSGARVVVTDAAHAEVLASLRPELPALRHVVQCDAGGASGWRGLLGKAADTCETAATRADDPALLIYTSGTTGPPKGASIAHRALIGNLPGFELSQNFYPREHDVFWTPADWAWTGGLLDALLPTLAYGRPIVAQPPGKFDPERALATCAAHKVTNAFIPPTALKLLRQAAGAGRLRNSSLRAVMSAGEPLGAELFAWGREAFGLDINEMWGQTEFNYLVGNCSAVMPVRPGAMGKPYPGHRVEPIDAEGKVMADGEKGELAALAAGDPVMFLGYWNNPEAAREKMLAGWFRTGDVGYRDADGYLHFVGRRDDVISSAGYRIGPGEIEDSLLRHPAVAQAAVIGKPDALRGELVKAFVVLAAGFAPSATLADEIRASVKARLSAHEYPRELEFVEDLPMTTTGKVRRIALREREIARRQDPGKA